MKTKKRDLRDSGIRLKPTEQNILKNFENSYHSTVSLIN